MTFADNINGLYEMLAGLFILQSCIKIHKDKSVKGISLVASGFFCSWGYWNLYYYPSLDQWFSFIGGIGVVITNTWWLIAAIYYTQKEKYGKFRQEKLAA